MQVPEYITVKNASNQTVAFLSPDDGLKDCYIDTRLNGESRLDFQIPAENEKWSLITAECKIIAGGREFTLLHEDALTTERDESNKLWGKVFALEAWEVLDTKYAEPYISNDPFTPTPANLTVIIVGGGSDLSGGRYAVGSAGHALYALLQGTGWSVGTVDVTGVHDLETEKESILANIKKVQEIWGGYLVWDSVNKTVSLRAESTWQPYTGFQVRYAKNLKHITKTQSNRLVTKLYPFGKDNLDIASVNGGLKYITNFSYTSREYVGIIKYPDIENAQELKDKATAELSLICRPRYLYSVKMVDLRTLPEYSHEDFTVGDMADVIDPAIGTAKVRIIRHKYNVFQPWKCELELGDPEERLVESLKASFSTTGFVDSVFNSSGKMSGYNIQNASITGDKIANATITGNNIASASITGSNIGSLTITAQNISDLTITGGKIANATITDAKIANLSASKLTAGTIDASVITVTNINASNITTGKLSASRIETVGLAAEKIYQPGYASNYLVVGGSFGDLILYYSGSEYFRIYNTIGGVSFKYQNTEYLASSGSSTTAWGTWNFSGVLNYGGYEVATKSWVSSNYALINHSHSNYCTVQLYGGYLEFWQNGVFVGKCLAA